MSSSDVPVYYLVRIYNVWALDMNKQTFCCSFQLSFFWMTGRAFKHGMDFVARPDFRIRNNVEVNEVDERSARVYWTDEVSKSLIGFRRRYIGELSATFNLRAFPLDAQALSIIVYIPNTTRSKRRYTFVPIDREIADLGRLKTRESFSIDEGVSLPSWAIHEAVFESGKDNQLSMHLQVSRSPNYYFQNIVLVQAALSASSLIVFAFHPSDYPSRSLLGIGMLTTVLMFRWTVGASLPNIPYLTSLDIYLNSSFLFILFILVESALVSPRAFPGFLSESSKEKAHTLAQEADNLFCMLFSCVLAVFHLVIFVRYVFVYRRFVRNLPRIVSSAGRSSNIPRLMGQKGHLLDVKIL